MSDEQTEPQYATCDGVTRMVHTETRNRLAADLESAAIRLRDAELEKQAAGKAYGEALKAFNEFVAPVKP